MDAPMKRSHTKMRRTKPCFNPDKQMFEFSPQHPRQYDRQRNKFIEQTQTLERGISRMDPMKQYKLYFEQSDTLESENPRRESMMQRSTSASDIQAALQFTSSQSKPALRLKPAIRERSLPQSPIKVQPVTFDEDGINGDFCREFLGRNSMIQHSTSTSDIPVALHFADSRRGIRLDSGVSAKIQSGETGVEKEIGKEKVYVRGKAARRGGSVRKSPAWKKGMQETESRLGQEGREPTRMEETEKLLLEILENQRKQAAELKETAEEWKGLMKQEITEQFRMMKEDQEHEKLKLRDEWEELRMEWKKLEDWKKFCLEWRKDWEEYRKDWERRGKDLEGKIDHLQSIVVKGVEDQQGKTWMMMTNLKLVNDDLLEAKLKRNIRKLLVDSKVSSYEKAEIAAKLLELKFDESEAVEAANECSTIELAVRYLQQECKLCFELFPMSKMVAMLSCEHQCCRNCAEEYFKTQIRNCNVVDIQCPFCNPLSITDDEEVLNEYFSRMDILLRDLVSAEMHELFQQKLRDWTFDKLGNVKWCAQCKNGYGINDPNEARLVCPHCNYMICTLCECKWEKQHNGIPCELYAEWKKANDPEFQADGLEKHLAEHGISCPMCHFKYSLAKGGCMHFKCLQCKFEFCSGCGQPFRMGQKCNVSSYCEKLGLHAHHPRNCLFYLRDKEPDALQKLLNDSCVPYDTETAQNDKCLVNVQVETQGGLVDGHCGTEVGQNYAGLCRLHYVEYLVDMINRNGIDPIATLDEAELAQELRRHCKEVPDKAPEETDVAYCVRLRKLITEQIPLEDFCAPTQA